MSGQSVELDQTAPDQFLHCLLCASNFLLIARYENQHVQIKLWLII